jgi:heme-degrading monooxygenase HmoA
MEADMITEIARIEIKPGTEKEYEAAIAKAAGLRPVKGFRGCDSDHEGVISR